MKIENCVRIIDWVLQTTPSVDAFERLIGDAHRILRGDCFFDKDRSFLSTHQILLRTQ